MQEKFNEIARHIDKAKKALQRIETAENAAELRDAWEDFLHGFHRSIGRIISLAIDERKSRSWGYRLKYASTNDDEGMVYLREARAQAEHGLVPFAGFRDPIVNIGGGAIHVGGNSSVTIRGGFVNGRPTGDFRLDTKGGKISNVLGKPLVPLAEETSAILLQPIKSEEKKKVFVVPASLRGRVVDANTPATLAHAGAEVLDELFDEIKDQFA